MQRRRPAQVTAALVAGAAALVTAGFVASGGAETRAAAAPARATPPAPQRAAVPTPAAPTPGRPGPDAGPTRRQAVDGARALIARHGSAVRAGRKEEYQVRSVLVDDDGARHVRFDRTYDGLPVLGGDYVVHADPDGTFRHATVAQDATIDVGTRPAITGERADAVAAGAFGGRVTRSTHSLVVDAAAGAPVLSWRVLVEGGKPPRSVEVVVDARTGAVRRSVDTLHTAADGTGRGLHAGDVPLSTHQRKGVYELVDPARGNGETRDARDRHRPGRARTEAFTDRDNAWGDGTVADRATLAVDVHHGVQRTWDYFLRAHDRAGIADDGRGALAMVHDEWVRANAAWDDVCFCMRFGDGDPDGSVKAFTPLDIVAHEMSHGVTSATADLYYFGQSGALNEATSDIFGTLVEFDAGNPVDPPDYLVGELLDNGGEGKPLRYMNDPARDGKSVPCWDGTSGFNTDVHYLSGVPNKFFYTLAEGSGQSEWGQSVPCSGAPAVAGIGRDKAGAIWYRALTRYMVTNTDFPEARLATLRAAADLHGPDSAEHAAVDAAWDAVNVDGSDPKTQSPVLTNPGDRTGKVGDVVRLQVEATDPQGDVLRFTARDLPKGLSMSDSGLITGTLAADTTVFPEVTVTDPAGYLATVSFRWDVSGAPVIKDPGPQLHSLTQYASLRFEAEDRDWDLTWTFTGLPDGITPLTGGSGYVSGFPTKVGTYEVTATVTDRENLSSTLIVPWTIVKVLPTGPPTALTATRSGTDVTVDWDTPNGDWNTVTGYEVTATPGGASASTDEWYLTDAVLHDLDPATAYTISVVAVNPAGRSKPATIQVPAVSGTPD
jgi:Zn-dependent metalloprotease